MSGILKLSDIELITPDGAKKININIDNNGTLQYGSLTSQEIQKMAGKIKANKLILQSPNGLVEKTISVGNDGIIILPCTIVINGAISETISYTGASSGSVLLNSSGTATISLYSGVYTFTGSVSGYSKTNVNVYSNQTINVYPDNTFYWYGKEVVTITLSPGGPSAYANKYTNYFNFTNANANNSGGYLNSAYLITTGTYSKLNFIAQGTSSSSNNMSISYTGGSLGSVSLSDYANKTTVQITPSSVQQSVTVGAYFGYNCNLNFYAIWLS